MRMREAKDFLVSEIKRQAEIENVPLAEPEIRMLYFTEQGGLSDEMQSLNEKFNESDDNAKYESKIAGLMKRAYKRIKRDDKPAHENWESAINCLKRGDHYILVMWGGNSAPQAVIFWNSLSWFAPCTADCTGLPQEYDHQIHITFLPHF